MSNARSGPNTLRLVGFDDQGRSVPRNSVNNTALCPRFGALLRLNLQCNGRVRWRTSRWPSRLLSRAPRISAP